MKSILEKLNLILLLVLVVFVGFNIYLNLTGYANPQTILDTLQNDYLYDIPSDDRLKEGQLKGLVDNLGDPYAQYIPESEVDEFNDALNQRYQGIGVSFSFSDNDNITVTNVFEGSPAQKEGVLENDVLRKINNETIDSKTQSQIIEAIRGEEGSTVSLTFDRLVDGQNTTIKKEITRARVTIELVEIETKNNQAMITIRSFGDSVFDDFKAVARTIENDPSIDTIILNVMNNPGGRLDHAVSIISTFIGKKGEVVLYEKTKNDELTLKSSGSSVDLSRFNIKILQNESSASASEILAASLRELRGARVFGSTSFGKGVVQKVRELPDGSLLKYTVAEWLTPEKRSIDKVGVEPDVFFNRGDNFEEKVYQQ